MISKTLRELIIIIFVACFIGAAMSLVTNMFVSGVEAIGALRKSSVIRAVLFLPFRRCLLSRYPFPIY